MATIELFKMYTIDTPCESCIFKTVSPNDFKFEIESHTVFDLIDAQGAYVNFFSTTSAKRLSTLFPARRRLHDRPFS